MKRKPIKGEILYDLNIGNATSRWREQVLTPVVVTSVGNKYFKCSPDGRSSLETTYYIENWKQKTDYCQDHKLYENPQDWYDEKESTEIYNKLREIFVYNYKNNIPLETLRAIKSLLDNPKGGG